MTHHLSNYGVNDVDGRRTNDGEMMSRSISAESVFKSRKSVDSGVLFICEVLQVKNTRQSRRN